MPKQTTALQRYKKNLKDQTNASLSSLCSRCFSPRIGHSRNSEIVCFSCGLVNGTVFDQSPEWWQLKRKTYKRIFYFNERCSRWVCDEPSIPDECFSIIHLAAKAYLSKHKNIKSFSRSLVFKILKSVKLTPEFQEKYRSKKFKKTLFTKKRFYDKYSEKWKSIIWRLTGMKPKIPPQELVNLLKTMFCGMQKPFELFKHAPECDGRYDCDKYFSCWHNCINYDFIFRKLLQIAEIKYRWVGVYELFKEEFPLVSQKIRDHKLRPMMKKICDYNNWPCPNSE